MAWLLREDVKYTLRDAPEADLGDIASLPAPTLEQSLGYVRARGTVGLAHSIRYERPLASGSYRVMPLRAQRADAASVWVEVHLPEGADPGRFVPPDAFAGRLERFDAADFAHRSLAAAIATANGKPLPHDAYLLVDGEAPGDRRWMLLVFATFVAFAVWNLVSIHRITRRIA
jgi:hypothetical protein